MNFKYLFAVVMIGLLLSSCEKQAKDSDSDIPYDSEFIEYCHDGIVYLSKMGNYQNTLTVKYNNRGYVSRRLKDGRECSIP